jgi:hypothetical protein
MDFQSAMETFAEAWVAANTKGVPGGSNLMESSSNNQQVRRYLYIYKK